MGGSREEKVKGVDGRREIQKGWRKLGRRKMDEKGGRIGGRGNGSEGRGGDEREKGM